MQSQNQQTEEKNNTHSYQTKSMEVEEKSQKLQYFAVRGMKSRKLIRYN